MKIRNLISSLLFFPYHQTVFLRISALKKINSKEKDSSRVKEIVAHLWKPLFFFSDEGCYDLVFKVELWCSTVQHMVLFEQTRLCSQTCEVPEPVRHLRLSNLEASKWFKAAELFLQAKPSIEIHYKKHFQAKLSHWGGAGVGGLFHSLCHSSSPGTLVLEHWALWWAV